MKIGNLVRIKPTDGDPMGRVSGVVLRFDVHHPDSSSICLPIVEVLWNTDKSWILKDRIEVLEND